MHFFNMKTRLSIKNATWLLLLSASTAQASQPISKDHYLIVDGGSSSSRVHLCYEADTPTGVACKQLFETRKGLHHHQIKDAASRRHRQHHHPLKQHLRHLVNSSIRHYRDYKKKQHIRGQLQGFHVYATAGMRHLGLAFPGEIAQMHALGHQYIEDQLEKRGFEIPVRFKTITMEEEASYAWFSVNANRDASATQNTWEMGGYSTQTASLLPTTNHRFSFDYQNAIIRTFIDAYGLGLDKTWNALKVKGQPHPCAFKTEALDPSTAGQSCREAVAAHHASFNIRPMTASDNPILLLGGGFKYTLQNLNLAQAEPIRVDTFKQILADEADFICSLSRAEFKNEMNLTEAEFGRYHYKYCFNLMHYQSLLEHTQLPDTQTLDVSFTNSADWLEGQFMLILDKN
jgi:hypothetical protein